MRSPEEGVVREGVFRKGVVRKGVVREGMVREGVVREGVVREDMLKENEALYIQLGLTSLCCVCDMTCITHTHVHVQTPSEGQCCSQCTESLLEQTCQWRSK